MARGRQNKRGGGSRFAAQSAEEIEQRNARLAELDEERANRREEEAEVAKEDAQGKSTSDEKKDGIGEDKNAEKDSDEKFVKFAEEVGERVVATKTVSNEPPPETRKEREDRQKAEAAAAYRKRHEAGLTEEYKKDMAKLAEVKARREAVEAKAKVEREAQLALEEEQRKKAEAMGAISRGKTEDHDDDDAGDKKKKKKEKEVIPKLDKIAIKKMKPAQMKDALKLRGLDIQSTAKQLTERLVQYEASR